MLLVHLMWVLAQVPTGSQLLAMPLSKQAELMASLTVEQRTQVVTNLSIEELVALELRGAQALTTYSATVVRSERVDGKMTSPESMTVWIQADPLAIRLDCLSGPSKGRQVLYNASLRRDQIRAKEGGVLGVIGGVWVDVDSAFTRRDSNHRITDLSLRAVVELIQRIVKESHGALTRTFVRVDSHGVCERFDSPPGTTGLYATSSLLCFDPVASVPTFFEIADSRGLLERYAWSNLTPGPSLASNFFTPQGTGW